MRTSLMTGKLLVRLCALWLCLCISGCHPKRPDAGFLEEPELLKEDARVPFNGFWSAPGVDLRTFNKIYVAPVDTTHLLKMSWWEKLSAASESSSANPEAEARYLADQWQKDLVTALKEKKDTAYQVVDQPDNETLVIELAITEVVPTKVWLNLISYVAAGAVDNGLTAMEGRFRPGAANDPIIKFKDARTGQYDIVSVADLQWYSHSKHTLDHWTDQIVELSTSAPDAHISSPYMVTLRPW